MSRATCPFVLVLSTLAACVEPAVQGATGDGGGSGSDGTTAGPETGGQPPEGTSDDAGSGTSGPGPTTGGPPPPPGCGDGVLDDGEVCDDGDADNDDACTSKCAPPGCDDGFHNNGESDVDCGGAACMACVGGQDCASDGDCASGVCQESMQCVPLVRTCSDLLGVLPGLPSGSYPIDPDGDLADPIVVFCDMNGGWTEVFHDEFTPPQAGWTTPADPIGACGSFAELLGGPGKFGAGATATVVAPMLGVPHTELRLVAEVIIIDSWDSENLVVTLDNQPLVERTCRFDNPDTCGQLANLCGAMWQDGKTVLDPAPVGHTQNQASVAFSTTLTEGANNEAWGLDRLVLFVR